MARSWWRVEMVANRTINKISETFLITWGLGLRSERCMFNLLSTISSVLQS